MLRARDFDHIPSDLGTQKRRLRRQRILETALPCAIVSALLVAAVFTVGHVGVYVCGPEAMSDAAENAAVANKCLVHRETFEF